MSTYVGTLRWFGHAYDAPAWEGMPEVPTPVGDWCLGCGEPIARDDDGITIPYTGPLGTMRAPEHVECFIRSVLGSTAHLDGTCSCGGGDPHLPDYRTDAREVMARMGPRRL